MKKITALCLLSLILCMSIGAFPTSAATPDANHPIAKAAYGTPVIDGEIDDIWATAEVNKIEGAFVEDGPDPANPRNGTEASFRALWDEHYLYILTEVTDSTIGDEAWELTSVGAGSLWQRNSLGYTITPDYNRDVTNGQVAPSMWLILSCRAIGGGEAAAGDGTANFNQVDREVFNNFKTKITSTGYLVEIAFDLNLRYPDMKMEEGACIGFDQYVNDNIPLIFTTRVIGLNWSDINSYKNNSLKGTIVLTKGNAETTSAPAVDTTAAPTTTGAPVTTAAPSPTTTAAPAVTDAPITSPQTADSGIVLAVSILMLTALVISTACVKKRN